MELNNPQEPPVSCSLQRSSRLPYCIYDLFLDLPHPAASSTTTASASSNDQRSRIIDPPVTICSLLSQEMYTPENIARISKLAFPEFDETHNSSSSSSGGAQDDPAARRQSWLTSGGRTFGANLSKHDVYLVDFIAVHHTSSILLSDRKTRVHGHVRRYLPPHGDAVSRTDVGRRRPRAMVLLTRAMGGERFYASVLK